MSAVDQCGRSQSSMSAEGTLASDLKGLEVFEAEGHEDVVPLAFEVVLCDCSRRSKLVEVVEPGHDLGLVDRFGALLVSALLASFALGRLAVVALSGDASLVCAVTHLDVPSVVPPTTWPRATMAVDGLGLPRLLFGYAVFGGGEAHSRKRFEVNGEARSGTTGVSRTTSRRIWLRDRVGRQFAIGKLRTFKSASSVDVLVVWDSGCAVPRSEGFPPPPRQREVSGP